MNDSRVSLAAFEKLRDHLLVGFGTVIVLQIGAAVYIVASLDTNLPGALALLFGVVPILALAYEVVIGWDQRTRVRGDLETIRMKMDTVDGTLSTLEVAARRLTARLDQLDGPET